MYFNQLRCHKTIYVFVNDSVKFSLNQRAKMAKLAFCEMFVNFQITNIFVNYQIVVTKYH